MTSPSVHCTLGVNSPTISSVIATTSAGAPPRSVKTNTRVSCDIRRFLGGAIASCQDGRKKGRRAQRKIIGPIGPVGLIGPIESQGIAGVETGDHLEAI